MDSFDEFFFYVQKCFVFFEEVGWKDFEVLVNFFVGIVYLKLGDLKRGFEFYKKFLDVIFIIDDQK